LSTMAPVRSMARITCADEAQRREQLRQRIPPSNNGNSRSAAASALWPACSSGSSLIPTPAEERLIVQCTA
jgi:hypothetical protein